MKRIPHDLPGAHRPTAPPLRVLAMQVLLAAPDLDASVAFYVALGLRTVECGVDDDDRRWARLALPDTLSAQLLLQECPLIEPIELRLEVRSLTAALQALAPVAPWAARADAGAGSACVTDPAGHPVVLVAADP